MTMNATAIVHEAYLKLVGSNGVASESRGHFFAVAAKAVPQVLCNYARDRLRLKRGGDVQHLSLDDALHAIPIELPEEGPTSCSRSTRPLRRLERTHPRQGRVVECRFFGGLSIEDTASALGISPATAKRDWALARAWLYREIRRLE
jgi:RNA polymerase sigma factor (TIGR02999 family)